MEEPEQTTGIDPLSDTSETWGPYIDGDEVRRLRNRYQERVSDDDWDEVIETSAAILGRCPEPSQSNRAVTGLALGKVQSGKTLSYTSLIALAIDNGYRITVVLAGTKNPLLKQNYNRLFNDLDAQRPSVTPFQNPELQDAEVIKSVLHGGGHALIVVLKNRQRLEEVRRVLASPDIHNSPTLIVDDEGDEASLNTQFRRGRQSAVYRSILALRDVLSIHAYVAYTATPQANVLISGIDGLSPDFGVLIEPGSGYCGGSTFFGSNRQRYVRLVPLSEADPSQFKGIPAGLRQAIAAFFVGGAIRHLRESNEWHSMLIHNSNLRRDHQSLQAAVRNLVELWRDRLRLADQDPAKQEVLSLLKSAYADLSSTVAGPPSWDDVREQLQDEVWLVEVWMVNSLPLGRDPVGTPFRLRNNILIGGNMVGRGVTIEGLAVTYITRRAKNDTNADTMEQRARWFGYKSGYLDVCRIFVTSQLRDDYTELLRHEDDFWEALRRNQLQGLSIREWPRLLSLDSGMGLRPTRASVARYRRFMGGNWDTQTRLVEDHAVAARNVRHMNMFFERRPDAYVKQVGNVEHLVIDECPTEVLIADLLTGIDSEGTNWDSAYTIEFISRLLLGGVLPTMEVVFMTQGQARERTKRSGIVNPMQGRSPERNPARPAFYPGDEHFHEGNIQLQAHVIRIIGDEEHLPVETTALALFVPRDDPRFDLRYVVRVDDP